MGALSRKRSTSLSMESDLACGNKKIYQTQVTVMYIYISDTDSNGTIRNDDVDEDKRYD